MDVELTWLGREYALIKGERPLGTRVPAGEPAGQELELHGILISSPVGIGKALKIGFRAETVSVRTEVAGTYRVIAAVGCTKRRPS